MLNLKKYRIEKRYTQQDVAAACGLTISAIGNYEAGRRTPTPEILSNLLDKLV